MPVRAKGDQIYVANESGYCEVDGQGYTFIKNITRVREGHVLMKSIPQYFDPIDLSVHYDVESATAAPGERRGQNA